MKSDRADLESKGFVCKDVTLKDKQILSCKNFEMTASVFGHDVRGVEVIFAQGQKNPYRIAVNANKQINSTEKMLSLFSELDKYYESIPDKSITMPNAVSRQWKTKDTNVLQFMYIQGVPGLLESSVMLSLNSTKNH
ncbi:hypothetical protein C1882_18240 [Pseudomonas sp. FW305-E2]|nr:hypothetical protein C1882_18240 [Pseudomonas sp. FW305-E2]